MIPVPRIDPHTLALIRMAVREDLGHASYGTVQGDRTVQLSIPQDLRGVGTIVARKPGVIAGTFLTPQILREYHVGMDCSVLAIDGTPVGPGQPVLQITGSAGVILSAERVILNFLGHLSGIATQTRRYVQAVANVPTPTGKPPAICDTRKTTPAFRNLDKYAVLCGGGTNHRLGLYDGVMLKDNHLVALRDRLGKELSLAQLTARIRGELPKPITLWLEVDSLAQLAEALPGGGADVILVDNFTPAMMREAVTLRNAHAAAHPADVRPLLEASGGITLENIADVAATGVERISIGALTHSAPVLDLSMELA